MYTMNIKDDVIWSRAAPEM